MSILFNPQGYEQSEIIFYGFLSSAKNFSYWFRDATNPFAKCTSQETLIMKVKRKFLLLIKLNSNVKDYAIWALLSDMLLTLNISSVIIFSPGFRILHYCFSCFLLLFKWSCQLLIPHYLFSFFSPRSTSCISNILFSYILFFW